MLGSVDDWNKSMSQDVVHGQTVKVWRCFLCPHSSRPSYDNVPKRCTAVKLRKHPELERDMSTMVNSNYAKKTGDVAFCQMWKMLK
jgi:hypothetical protein